MMQVVSIFIARVLSGANVMVTGIGDNKKTAKFFFCTLLQSIKVLIKNVK